MSELMSELMTATTSPIPSPIPTLQEEKPDYVIVEQYSVSELETIVTKLMANGWKPTGGVHVRKSPQWSHIFTQALTKGI